MKQTTAIYKPKVWADGGSAAVTHGYVEGTRPGSAQRLARKLIKAAAEMAGDDPTSIFVSVSFAGDGFEGSATATK